MNPEIRHLLDGYATGTLTEAERARLLAAALEDQALFDALAEEQVLKDLLDDPESRGYLLAELDLLAEKNQDPQPILMDRSLNAKRAATPMAARQSPVPVAAPPPPAKPPARFWLPFAAVMMALLVTGWFWWRHTPVPQQEVAVNRPPVSSEKEVPAEPPPPQPTETVKKAPAASPPLKAPEADRRAATGQAAGPALSRTESVPAQPQEAPQELEKKAEKSTELRANTETAPAPVAAAARAAPRPAMAAGNLAATRAAYRLLKLENGQYVPTANTRFQAGDSIVILLPADPTPHLTYANGNPIALEREGDWYRSAKIELAAGTPEFLASVDRAVPGRSRFSATDRAADSAAKAKSAPADVVRIRLTVD